MLYLQPSQRVLTPDRRTPEGPSFHRGQPEDLQTTSAPGKGSRALPPTQEHDKPTTLPRGALCNPASFPQHSRGAHRAKKTCPGRSKARTSHEWKCRHSTPVKSQVHACGPLLPRMASNTQPRGCSPPSTPLTSRCRQGARQPCTPAI